MSGFTPLTWAQLQQGEVADYNAAAVAAGSIPAYTGPGGALGPIFNAVALLGLQLQAEILYVQSIERLATSVGNDIDTFVLPFGYLRIAAISSTGTVTFGTTSPASQNILIPAATVVDGVPSGGTLVQTTTGVQYAVIPDLTNPAYFPTLNAYILPQSSSSVSALVQALVPGAAGNAQAQTITLIVSSPSNPAPIGIATVINTSAFTNGADRETDLALITRFQLGMQNRWATDGAVLATTAGVQSGLTYVLGDMLDAHGGVKPNFFTVVVNQANQSSGPSTPVLVAVTSAIETVRPVGMPYTVVGPTLFTINGAVTVQLQVGADPTAVTAALQAAFISFINGIGLGNLVVYSDNVGAGATTCSYAKLEGVLLAVPGVNNIVGGTFLLNGGIVDISAAYGTQLVAGTLTVVTS